MGVVFLVLHHRCKPSWSHNHAISLFVHFSPLAYHLSIYLSVCLSFYLSIYQGISVFVWISLSNSNYTSSPVSLSPSLHLLSLYLSCSLPHSLNGTMVPTVVQLWYYMQHRIDLHCLVGSVIYTISACRVWDNSYLALLVNTTVSLGKCDTKYPKLIHPIDRTHILIFIVMTLTCILLKSNIWHLLSQTAVRCVENGKSFF